MYNVATEFHRYPSAVHKVVVHIATEAHEETPQRDVRVAGVRFQPTGRIYSFDASDEPDLQPGDYVLVETSRGQQLGEVVVIRAPKEGQDEQNLSPVLRKASGRDLTLRMQWQEREAEALRQAEQLASEMRLPAKIVAAEYTFDGRQLTLLYVCEEKKIAIERLAQRLERSLQVQVDPRRVGPRDHAKMIGGYGPCGEPRCCSRFLSEFAPVSIKMAKEQGFSMNPTKISGACGRLMCCFKYEQEAYEDAHRRLPRQGDIVMTEQGQGVVIGVHLLKETLTVRLDLGNESDLLTVDASTVEVLGSTRPSKGKKGARGGRPARTRVPDAISGDGDEEADATESEETSDEE